MILKILNVLFCIFIFIILNISSCTTTQPNLKNPKITKLQTQKKGYKDKSNLKQHSDWLTQNQYNLNNYLSLYNFISRHLNKNTPLVDKDEELLASISTPILPESIEEAVVIIGILKKYIHSQLPDKQYEEQDLYQQVTSENTNNNQNNIDTINKNNKQEKNSNQNNNDNLSTQQSAQTLQALFEQKNINLENALNKNIFLQHVEIYKMLLLAISATQTTHELNNVESLNVNNNNFNKIIYKTITNKIKEWINLQKTFAIELSEDSQITSNMDTQTTPNQNTPFISMADINKGDELLAEAQILADNKNYKEAIIKAELIPQNSPFYNAAQEKIVFFSNLAIQDLRKKAANIYQYAFSISDIKIKINYLKEAKKFLILALSEYPKASLEQLSKVKNNLDIINKELANFEQINTPK